MSKLLWMIYGQPLYKIVLLTALLIVVWGIIGSREDGKLWWKLFNIVLFLCIMAVIIYMTVYSREKNTKEVILIPFQSFIEAKEQPEMYRSMLMNVFLFVPLGLSLPNVQPVKWHPAVNIVLTVLFGCCLSTVIEWCQYQYGLGRCEVDDVIMNTLGAVIGAQAKGIAEGITKRKANKAGSL